MTAVEDAVEKLILYQTLSALADRVLNLEKALVDVATALDTLPEAIEGLGQRIYRTGAAESRALRNLQDTVASIDRGYLKVTEGLRERLSALESKAGPSTTAEIPALTSFPFQPPPHLRHYFDSQGQPLSVATNDYHDANRGDFER
jgi:hypothetical protein